MPAGITHLTLSRRALDYLEPEDVEIKKMIARNLGPFLVGCVSPDLPYMGYFSKNPSDNNKVADDLHYVNTNLVPLRGLEIAKQEFEKGNKKLAEGLFAFYVGYAAHLIADGIVHPYVRDYVGDYKVAATAHRALEMRLDVLVAQKILDVEMNGVSLQDDLELINNSPFKDQIFASYAMLIKEVHGHDITMERIDDLVQGMGRALNISEGKFPQWYSVGLSEVGLAYMDLDDVKKLEDKITNLLLPIDAKEKGLTTNFMGTAFVNFFDHVVPRVFEVLPGRIKAAHDYVFKNGPELDKLIPLINLDTGRVAGSTDLSKTPELWVIA